MYVSLSEIQIKEEEEAMNRPFTKVGDHFTCVASVGWFPRVQYQLLVFPRLSLVFGFSHSVAD